VRRGARRALVLAGLIWPGALAAQCGSSSPSPAPAPAAAPVRPAAPALETALTPTLTVRELMEHIIDPTADSVFDAAVIDVTAKGVVETKPLTDEDWLKVERAGLLLAESANLLKMPRRMAPPTQATQPHKGAEPELPPEQIEAKVDRDRALWNKYSDGFRDAALSSVKVARARDFEALFNAGSDIDKACEACHLEYWYPGDRKLVEQQQKSRVTYDPPKR
jgi:hypothetical protein